MLLPAIIAVLMAIQYRRMGGRQFLFICGLMASISFLFRQTGAVVIIPICVYFIITPPRGVKSLFRKILDPVVFCSGFLLPIAMFAAYFLAKGALGDAFSQVFCYNWIFLMSNKIATPLTFMELIRHTFRDSFFMSSPYLVILGFAGMMFQTTDFIKEARKNGLSRSLEEHNLFVLALSWFLADLYCVSLSGRYYWHYYVQALPSLTLLAGFAIKDILDYFKPPVKSVFLIGVLYLFLSPLFYNIHENIGFTRNVARNTNEYNSICINGIKYISPRLPVNIVRWIMSNTSEDDFIYFWGEETGLNFLTKRRSPSKYTYLSPLRTTGYGAESDSARFISDLNGKAPRFVIDASFGNGDIRSLNDPRKWQGTLLADPIEFIHNNYIYYITIDGWDIYKRRVDGY
jgi:hypothetical protein